MIQYKLYAVISLVAMLAYFISYTDGQPMHQYASNFEVIGHVFLLLACADWIDKRYKNHAKGKHTDVDGD